MTKRYMDMTATEICDAYTSWTLLLNNASRGNMAASVFRCQREIDLLVNCARKRGIVVR